MASIDVQLEKLFKKCEKSINLMAKHANIIRVDLETPPNTGLMDRIEVARNIPAYRTGAVREAFWQNVGLIPYYCGFATEDVLRRDMLIQIGNMLHYTGFAGENGAIFYADIQADSDSEQKETLKELARLFEDNFGFKLHFSTPNVSIKEILDKRLAATREYYLDKHGGWIKNFGDNLQDEVSGDSFLTFLRQRITTRIFADNPIRYPIMPPLSTRAWREEREKMKYDLPKLFDMHNNMVDDIYYAMLFKYEQYGIPTGGGSEVVEPQPGDTVIDAGAFIGDTAAWFSQKVGPNGKVYAFEITPATVERARANMALNNMTNVEIINAGLSDRNGIITIKENEAFASANRFILETEKDTGIPLRTLDSLRPQYGKIDYIKADVEGSEMALLRGARETIRQDKPICAFCVYHKQDDFWEIPSFLQKLNPDYKFWFRCESEPVVFAKDTK